MIFCPRINATEDIMKNTNVLKGDDESYACSLG